MRANALADARATGPLGFRRATSANAASRSTAAASESAPGSQRSVASSSTATASAAIPSAKTAIGGVPPNRRGLDVVNVTGAGLVSAAGSARTAAAPSSPSLVPHSGQNRAAFGTGEPQLRQLARRPRTALLRLAFWLG